jgi:hypothetical protein
MKMFRIICHVWYSQTETSPNKFHGVDNDPLRFSYKVTIELGLDFQTFSIVKREHKL